MVLAGPNRGRYTRKHQEVADGGANTSKFQGI